jgi:hypothetical protein
MERRKTETPTPKKKGVCDVCVLRDCVIPYTYFVHVPCLIFSSRSMSYRYRLMDWDFPTGTITIVNLTMR